MVVAPNVLLRYALFLIGIKPAYLFLHPNEVAYLRYHAPYLRRVIYLNGMVDFAETQGTHGVLLLLGAFDEALQLCYLNLCHRWEFSPIL